MTHCSLTGPAYLAALALTSPVLAKDAAPHRVQPPLSWLTEALAQTSAAEYRFAPLADDVWSAPNRAHGLRSRVGPAGIEVFPRTASATSTTADWRLRMRTQSVGREGLQVPLGEPEVRVSGTRAELHHGQVLEWWINDERGLEHGWTLLTAPGGTGRLSIEVAIEGDLSLRVDPDGISGAWVDAANEVIADYGGLAAWDARGLELDARMLGTPRGLRISVDDAGATYPVTVDPLLSCGAWTAELDQASAFFGRSVAGAGDVNGDGFDDVAVAAPWYDSGELNEGAVFVYHGSSSGLDSVAAWSAEGNSIFLMFGSDVAAAGDVNGDGFGDLIIGVERAEQAVVYYGSPTGLGAVAGSTVSGVPESGDFGWSVASAGDVNGDGYSDVIVGAKDFSNGNLDEGRVSVFHGAHTGLQTVEAWSAESDNYSSYFSESVASAGDVNGDGYSDILVGAPRWHREVPQTNDGRVYGYYGSATGLSPTESWAAVGSDTDAFFGTSVACAGDVNGDGYSDVIVGEPGYFKNQIDQGRAYVFLGSASGLELDASWKKHVPKANADFGQAVAGAGDFNGDGFDDVLVGAPGYGNGQWKEGRAFIYPGSATGVAASKIWQGESDQALSLFGSAVAGAGDVNGDGYSDVIVGAEHFDGGEEDEGRAFVFHGSDWPLPTNYCTAGESASDCTALLSSSGVASATASSGFCLRSWSFEGDKDGLFFFASNGRQANPWGNGSSLQCVVPPVQRAGLLTGTGTAGQCDNSMDQDLNALWCPTCPKPQLNPGAGALVQAQLWYRDPFNTSNQTTSLSDAIEFVLGP